MTTKKQDSPAAGWYPDPGGQGLRYWDGIQWTDQTEQAGATQPGAVTKSHRLSGRNRWILVASLIVAVAIADLALRNIEMKRLMDAAFDLALEVDDGPGFLRGDGLASVGLACSVELAPSEDLEMAFAA